MSLPYVRDRYKVPAYRGAKVLWRGVEGRILSARTPGYLRILMDDGRRLLLHPTEDGLFYLDAQEKTRGGKLMIEKPNTQQIREFLDQDPKYSGPSELLEYLRECLAYIESLTEGVETTLDVSYFGAERGQCRASAYATNLEYRARKHRDAAACHLMVAEWLEGYGSHD